MANARTQDSAHTKRETAQTLALAVGVIYTLVGIAGFFVTGFDGFASNNGESLLGFEVNPLHNIVHLVIGIAGIVLSRSLTNTMAYGAMLAIGYGLAFVYGLVANGKDWDFLAINSADNILHILSALVGVGIAVLARQAMAQYGRARGGNTVGAH